MSLATGFHWNHKDISLLGYSLAGVTTSIAFPAADVCFDVGQGLPFQIPFTNIAITHGHLDHAAGLPYLLGQKAMHGAKRPNVYMPDSLVEPMREILNLWARIEDHTYDYHLEGLSIGESRALKAKFQLRPFRTYHRVDSQGYTVFQTKKRLLKEFEKLHPHELGQARKKGLKIEEHYQEPILSFSGDTKIEVLEDPQVRSSRVLILECTYWDDRKTVENAREWGHIHLHEIVPRLEELSCEKLLLIHSSARYSTAELKHHLQNKIPDKYRERVELFPRVN